MPNQGIVLYDFLLCLGGAERVSLELARELSADLGIAFREPGGFPEAELKGVAIRELGRGGRVPLRVWRTLHGLHAFRRHAGFLTSYQWVIYSGSNAPVAIHSRPKGGNIYYAHTPPRFAYDLYQYYLERTPPWQRPLLKRLSRYVRRQYEQALARMDLVLANSENVRARLQRYLGLEAKVVHPPCDVTGYRWQGQGNFYLSTARLEPYKRVDRIIEAFRALPDKKLVVASGGSEEASLRRLAEGIPNVKFVGWLGDTELKRLVGTAIATLYVPRDEDFGMSPVESMAAGKPVIGNAEGGLVETIVPGQTGLLLSSDPGPAEIGHAVRALTPQRALGMRRACEERAERFSRQRFFEAMQDGIDRVTGGRTHSG